MLQSTKIKILGIIGTIGIISTAYTLHAKAFYNELYPALSDKKRPLSSDKIVKIEKKVEFPAKNDNNESTAETKRDTITENKATVQIKKVESKEAEQQKQKDTVPTIDYMSELQRLLKEDRYLYIDESSNQITAKSKERLQKLKSLISKVDDIYIEVEGYSASKESSYKAKKDSENSARLIGEYLRTLDIDKEIVVTGYGDSYPIIEDTRDMRNSRVEVKIRRR